MGVPHHAGEAMTAWQSLLLERWHSLHRSAGRDAVEFAAQSVRAQDASRLSMTENRRLILTIVGKFPEILAMLPLQ